MKNVQLVNFKGIELRISRPDEKPEMRYQEFSSDDGGYVLIFLTHDEAVELLGLLTHAIREYEQIEEQQWATNKGMR